MDFPQRAVFFLEEDSSLPAHSKPLMLEAVLFCPILKWMSDKLLADGVQPSGEQGGLGGPPPADARQELTAHPTNFEITKRY